MNNDVPISDLLKSLRDDLTNLVRQEAALARTELIENMKETGKNAGLLAAGALIAFVAVIMLLLGCAKLMAMLFVSMDLSPSLADMLGYVVVAAAVGIAASAVLAKAYQALKDKPLRPDKTIKTLKEDKQWIHDKIA